MALEHRIAFDSSFRRQTITRSFTQEPGYTVFKLGDKVSIISATATGHVSIPWAGITPTLIEGIESIRDLEDTEEGRKLAIAIELFLSSFYENAERTRFITRITALEVLAPKIEKHSVAAELLKNLHQGIDDSLASPLDEEARLALESLRRELDFRKEQSIRRRIRRLVMDQSLDPVFRSELAKNVVAAYDARGQMVHEGTMPSDLRVMDEVVLDALRIIIRSRLGLTPRPSAQNHATTF